MANIERWTPCDICSVDILHKQDCVTLERYGFLDYVLCNSCYNKSFLKEIDDCREKKINKYRENISIIENISADDVPDKLIHVLYKEKQVDISTAKNKIAELFGMLTDREKYVIARRFGFFGQERATLMQLGKEYAVTKERVRSIEQRALINFRRRLMIQDENVDDDDILFL